MSVTEGKSTEPKSHEIEIRLSDIVQFLKSSRRTVISWALGGLVVGGVYAAFQPNQFTSYVTVMPELQARGTSSLGNLGAIAGLAGINLESGAGGPDAIRPDLYPSMLQSIPFGLYMLKQPVRVENRLFTIESYLDWADKNSLGSRIDNALFGWLSSDEPATSKSTKEPAPNPSQPLVLSRDQEGMVLNMTKRVVAEIDKKTGVITITAKMPDPVVAATVARLSLDYLTNYVTSYRTGKSRQQVTFLDKQVTGARRRYEAAEYNLSAYRDRNRSVFLNTAKIEEQRLQADYLLAQTVYNDLSKQLEQARIKVQEEAPVFQVLEPARVPVNKSEPKRTIIALGFAIFGAIIGLAIFLVRWLTRL
ncbi:GNVR domain-containing protein [Spirosoma rigui]|uniref:GNVR domain-containing protein n=1 Tax=Spirosoma rigui TaxID=564064 RepID=UPI0009B00738|nr:GNVR domain-containing protein [Spirosoma rigui]